MRTATNRLRAFVLLAASALVSLPAIGQDQPVIAAASDLKFAMEEIAQAFTAKTGKSVRLAFGSSGNFRRQIAEGAPFEMFMSADEGFVFALGKEGYTLDEGALYAIGRIVIIVPTGSVLKADSELKDLAAGLQDGRVKKFAIANPEHAPYGRAAQQALTKAGLWDKLQDKLVLGENISQATQFATSGSAQGGIIALSLALSPAVSKLGSYALLPAESHEPLRQRMVLLKKAGETAKEFYAFVQQPEARAIFRRYGFVLPTER
jgi:molybdate transport system substrate-binding protein